MIIAYSGILYSMKCLSFVVESVNIQLGGETKFLNNVYMNLLSQNPEKFNLLWNGESEEMGDVSNKFSTHDIGCFALE
jgi:hypothetical protein